MTNQIWTDEQLSTAIRGSSKQNETALRQIFQDRGWRSAVANQCFALGLPEDMYSEIFAAALIVFDRKIRTGAFRGESSLKTFFVGISKKMALKALEKKKRSNTSYLPLEHLPETDNEDDNPQTMMESDETILRIEQSIKKLKKDCQKIILMLREDYNNDDIAHALGYKDGAHARKFVYKCRECLRQLLQSD